MSMPQPGHSHSRPSCPQTSAAPARTQTAQGCCPIFLSALQCNRMFPTMGQILPQPKPRAPAPAQEQASCQGAGRSSERLKQKGSNIHPTSKQWSYVSSSAQGFPLSALTDMTRQTQRLLSRRRIGEAEPRGRLRRLSLGSDPERPGASMRTAFSRNNRKHLKGRTGKKHSQRYL